MKKSIILGIALLGGAYVLMTQGEFFLSIAANSAGIIVIAAAVLSRAVEIEARSAEKEEADAFIARFNAVLNEQEDAHVHHLIDMYDDTSLTLDPVIDSLIHQNASRSFLN